MKSYQAYLFDFDYTLADSSRGIVMCYRNVLERHGFHQVDDLSIKRTIGKTLVDSFSIMTGITDADTLETFRKEYVKEAIQDGQIGNIFEEADALMRAKAAGMGLVPVGLNKTDSLKQ